MKIIITESQYEMLFKELPSSLKRRITQDDLKYFDRELIYYIYDTNWTPDFNQFRNTVINSLVNEFVLSKKYDSLPEDVDVFDISPELNEVFDLYFEIIPFLEEKYKNKLYQNWKAKGKFI